MEGGPEGKRYRFRSELPPANESVVIGVTYPDVSANAAPPRAGGGALPVVVAVLAVLVAVIAVVVGLVLHGGSVVAGAATPATGITGGPSNVTGAGAVRVGDPKAKVVVRLVEDLQCPACQAFEKANGKVLAEAAGNGSAVIEYNIISFLDRASTTKYSSRAGNAAYCVADSGTANYQTWLTAMFEQQPKEGTDGLPDSKLVEIAKSAGYTDSAVAQCITSHKWEQFVRDNTKQVLAGGIKGTPSVFVNGNEITSSVIMTEGGLGPIIAAAR